jgi:spore maturation protein CgeB
MKTKVLLIGPKCFNYNQSVASAFNSDKFEVKIIDYAEQFGQINLRNKISYFFSSNRIATTSKLLSKLNEYILITYKHYCPDIVLIIKGDVIDEETVVKMSRSKNILWMMDGIFYNPQSIKLADKVDAVFLFEKTDIGKVRAYNKNTFYLPSAYDDQIFKKLQLEKDIDLLFIGTLHESRIKLLEKIRKRFPQLKIRVYCERFRFYKTPLKYLKSFTDTFYINRFVTPSEANVLYNRSKICLNIHHEQSVYGINPRFFEILGANAIQFVDHKPFIDDYFSDYNISTYTTDEELFQMISLQFNCNSQRSETTQQENKKLYDTVRKYHTYKNRVEFMLEKVDAEKSPSYLTPKL